MKRSYMSPYKKLLNLYHKKFITLYTYDTIQDKIYNEIIELHKKAVELNIIIKNNIIKIENNGKIDLYHHKELKLGGSNQKKQLGHFLKKIIKKYLKNGSCILNLNFEDENLNQSLCSFLRISFRRIIKKLSLRFKNVTYVVSNKEMFCYENLGRKYTRNIHCIEYFYSYNNKYYCSFIQFEDINVDKFLYYTKDISSSSNYRNILQMTDSKDQVVDYLRTILENFEQNNNYLLLLRDITSNNFFNIYKYYLYVSILRFLYFDNHEDIIFSFIENLKKSEIKKIIKYVNSISLYEDAYINNEASINHVPKYALRRVNLEYDTFRTKFNFFLKDLCNDEYPEIDETRKFKILERIVKYAIDKHKEIFLNDLGIYQNYNRKEVKELFEEIFSDIKYKIVYIIILINLRKESQGNKEIDTSSTNKKVSDCFIKTSSYNNEKKTIDEIISYKN